MASLQDHYEERLRQSQITFQRKVESNSHTQDHVISDSLRTELREKEKQIQRLYRQIEKLKETKESPDEEQPVNQDQGVSTEEISALKEELKNAYSELETEKETRISMEASLEELDSQHQEAIQQLLIVKDELVSSNRELTSKLEALEQENQNLKLSVGPNASRRDSTDESNKQEELQLQVKDLEMKCRISEETAAELRLQIQDSEPNEVNDELSRLSSENENLRNEADDLRSRMRETAAELDQLQQRCENARKENSDLCSELQKMDAKVEQKEKEYAQKEAITDEELRSLKTKNSELESNRETLVSENQSLMLELEKQQVELDQVKLKMFEEVSTLEEKVRVNEENKEAELEEFRKELDLKAVSTENDIEEVILRYKEELQNKDIELESLKLRFSKYETMRHQNETEMITLKTEVEMIRNELAKSFEDVEHLRTRLQSKETELEDLENRCSQNDEDELLADRNRKTEIQDLLELNSLLRSRLNEKEDEIELLKSRTFNDLATLKQDETERTDAYVQTYRQENCSFTQTEENLKDAATNANLKIEAMANFTQTEELEKDHDDLQEVPTKANCSQTEMLEDQKVLRSEDQEFSISKRDLENRLRQREVEVSMLTSKVETLMQVSGSSPLLLEEKLRAVEMEKERLLAVLNEKSRECSGLKMEVHRLFGVISAEKQAVSKLQQDNKELISKPVSDDDQDMMKEALQKLSRMIKDKDIEMEAMKQKTETLMSLIQQQNGGFNAGNDEKETDSLQTLLQEREELTKQLKAYQSDREQIAGLLNQKHQESLTYHAEIQRLNVVLGAERQQYQALRDQHSTVSLMFEEKQKSLLNTQNEVVSLKQRVTELERQHVDLREKYTSLVEGEMVHVKAEDLQNQQLTLEALQTRVAETEELLKEKDKMIYEMSQSLKALELESSRKGELASSLQHRLDTMGFQLNDFRTRLNESEEEKDSGIVVVEQLKQENAALQEANRSLTLLTKRLEFENSSVVEKMETMTRISESDVGDASRESEVLKEMDVLQGKVRELHNERDQVVLALNQQQKESREYNIQQKKLEEQNKKLHNELDRLRNHLLELEESYTKDLLEAEDREKVLRNKLSAAEQKANLSSSAIHNASQESQARVESLQQQLSQIIVQRDQALGQSSLLEDQLGESRAAITNLQSALEFLQGEQRRELEVARSDEQRRFKDKEKNVHQLKEKVSELEVRLVEANEALDAASRLSEQLDRKEKMIQELKTEVSAAKSSLEKAKARTEEIESHTEGKVDKQIMKSLVLGYLSSPQNQKADVVRLLARILDFNQLEMSKAGLKIGREAQTPGSTPGGRGWLTSILHRVTPPIAAPRTPSPSKPKASPPDAAPNIANAGTPKSFSSLFVEFLENESQPLSPRPPLLDTRSSSLRKALNGGKPFNGPSTHESFRSSPMLDIASHTIRGSGAGEHPLMRPLAASLPTFAPIPSSPNFLQDVLK